MILKPCYSAGNKSIRRREILLPLVHYRRRRRRAPGHRRSEKRQPRHRENGLRSKIFTAIGS